MYLTNTSTPYAVRTSERGWRDTWKKVWVAESAEQAMLDAQGLAAHVREHLDLYPGAVDVRYVHSLGPTYVALARAAVARAETLLGESGLVSGETLKQTINAAEVLGSQGAAFHNDTFSVWSDSLFWVFCLHACGVDLLFPGLGIRVPLRPGLLVVFDPAEPHGVVRSGKRTYRDSDFSAEELTQVFINGDFLVEPAQWRAMGCRYESEVEPLASLIEVSKSQICPRRGVITHVTRCAEHPAALALQGK